MAELGLELGSPVLPWVDLMVFFALLEVQRGLLWEEPGVLSVVPDDDGGDDSDGYKESLDCSFHTALPQLPSNTSI